MCYMESVKQWRSCSQELHSEMSPSPSENCDTHSSEITADTEVRLIINAVEVIKREDWCFLWVQLLQDWRLRKWCLRYFNTSILLFCLKMIEYSDPVYVELHFGLCSLINLNLRPTLSLSLASVGLIVLHFPLRRAYLKARICITLS